MYLLLALVPSLLFGSMAIVLMKFGGDSRQQTFGQLSGAALIAVVIGILVGFEPDLLKNVYGFVAGIAMALAVQFQLKAFHVMGVSRVMPLSAGGQLILMSCVGVFLFGEWVGTPALPVGILGSVLVVGGVAMTTWTQNPPDPLTEESEGQVYALGPAPEIEITHAETVATVTHKGDPSAPARSDATLVEQPAINWRRGFIQTTISTVLFVVSLTMIRWFEVDPIKSFAPQGLGWLVAGFVGTFPFFTKELGPVDNRWSKKTLWSVLPGFMWATGLLIVQFSQMKVGVAIGFSFSQLGVVISTVGGIWLLGETRTKKELRVIGIGVVLLVIGALVLGLAKSLDV